METLHNITDRLFVSLQQAREHPQGVSGLSTGFDVLNKLTTGWQKGELIVIAAPPRMGKRAFALTVLNNSMFDGSLGAFWFSTNLSANQLTNMLLCNNLNVDLHSLLSGNIDNGQLKDIVENIRFSGVSFDDSPYLTINDIETKLSEFDEVWEDAIVIIDNVNQLNYLESDQFDLADKFYRLKTLARKFEIPIIAIMETEKQQNNMSKHFRDCLSLSDYDAMSKSVDVRILLYRPEYYKITEFSDKSSTLGMAELIYSSHIGNGSVRLKFNPLFFKFSESNVSLNQCE